MKPLLILVGADKGGVGKTTTSRALLDFFARKNILTRAFDTENPRGTLHRFYPNITEIIDLNEVRDQMKVLDTMQTSAVKVTVVDLKAGNLSSALDTFDKIGVLEAARSGDFDIALLHVVGPSIASLDEMGEVAKYTKGVNYIVARNFINETNFFEWDEKTFKKYFAGLSNAREIEIPKLNEMAYELVDLSGVTFSDFIANKTPKGQDADYSFVLRGYVRKWISDIDAEFNKLELMKAILAPQTGESSQEEAETVTT
ncbi:MAG: hypothetical protein WBC71_09520 [Salaquimonas sp.]